MSTKSKSYAKTQVAEREYEVIRLLKQNGPMSRRQLAQAIGVESNSVSAAARNLILQGRVIELGETYDQETKRHQRQLAINTEPSTNPKKQPTNKSWKISSLELEVEQLKRRINLLVTVIRYVNEREAAVSKLIKEFHETQIQLAQNESK